MKQEKVVKKDASTKKTSSAGTEKNAVINSDYTRYFYKSIDRLWDAIAEMQQENIQLKAELRGEY